MQIRQYTNAPASFAVMFDFEDWSKIKLEAQRSQRLIPVIVSEILTYGIENYPFTDKQHAQA